MSTAKQEHQRPEGAAIERAMKSHKTSFRTLAGRVSMSDARVRQIVNGYASVGSGNVQPVKGPAETVARIALALRMEPGVIAEAGRPDAAELMDQLDADSDQFWRPGDTVPLADHPVTQADTWGSLASEYERLYKEWVRAEATAAGLRAQMESLRPYIETYGERVVEMWSKNPSASNQTKLAPEVIRMVRENVAQSDRPETMIGVPALIATFARMALQEAGPLLEGHTFVVPEQKGGDGDADAAGGSAPNGEPTSGSEVNVADAEVVERPEDSRTRPDDAPRL